MATWTNIPDSVLEVGKPARSIDAMALRDNPIAIAEGAPGAPKVEVFEWLFTFSDTFVAPKSGHYFIDVIGGGGNGNSGGIGDAANSKNGHGGTGGGAGEWVSTRAYLTEGVSYSVIVGGPASNSHMNTDDGLITASGGLTGRIAEYYDDGGNGEQGWFSPWGGFGAENGSNGSGNPNSYGVGGRGFGAGGGGGGGGSYINAQPGGSGGSGAIGCVRVRW